MNTRERQFPSRCPACGHLLAVTGKCHCGKVRARARYCPWITCDCGANITEVKK